MVEALGTFFLHFQTIFNYFQDQDRPRSRGEQEHSDIITISGNLSLETLVLMCQARMTLSVASQSTISDNPANNLFSGE